MNDKECCGKEFKIMKGIGDKYWIATCGKPLLYEKTEDGLVPCKIIYCEDCSDKQSEAKR